MLEVNGKSIDMVCLGDRNVSEIYCGDNLVWTLDKGDNAWINTYVTKQFLNVNGVAAVSTYKDMYESIYMDVGENKRITFRWDDSVRGTIGNAPGILVCFFNAYNRFISPRISTTVSESGRGIYAVDIPYGAVFVDVRIDHISSAHMQHFENFSMYLK